LDDWFLHVHEFLYTADEASAPQEAECVRRALGLQEGARVLDAPCAMGRIGFHLAKAGCRVTGVDINEGFLARARERFQEGNVAGSFCAMDLRRLSFPPVFDAAFNWWTSFGYFPDAENLQALCGMAAAVRPGGRVLIEQPNRQVVIRRLRPETAAGLWELHSRWDAARQRLESTWILFPNGSRRIYPMSMRWYTLSQFRALFRRAGLTFEAAYGDCDGSPYRRSSPRLIVVGRKAPTPERCRRAWAAG